MKNISSDSSGSEIQRAGVSLQNKRVKAVQGLKSFVDANLEAFLKCSLIFLTLCAVNF